MKNRIDYTGKSAYDYSKNNLSSSRMGGSKFDKSQMKIDDEMDLKR